MDLPRCILEKTSEMFASDARIVSFHTGEEKSAPAFINAHEEMRRRVHLT